MAAAQLGGCEHVILPNRWNLEAKQSGLPSSDFANAFDTMSRTVILDIWANTFPEALPFAQSIYAIALQTFTGSLDWTTPPNIPVEASGRLPKLLGLNLPASALQLVLVTVHRSLHSRIVGG